MIKIYFDVCCYNRPFDDLGQEKIRLEAEAILSICNNTILTNRLSVYSSPAVDFEIDKISNSNKKYLVQSFYLSVDSVKLEYRSQINAKTKEFETHNIKYMDALHMAFCEINGISYMLTTDKILLKAASKLNIGTTVISPIEFVTEVL